jgi:phytoene dehydrogenase-like protein
VHYNTKVAAIVVNDNKAAGVKLANGALVEADKVISAADGYNAIFKMLQGKYVDKDILARYNTGAVFSAVMQISLGVDESLHGLPHTISFPLLRPLIIDNKTRVDRLTVHIYNFDPELAPEGKTVVSVVIPCIYEYWVNLRHNNFRRYKVEKERIVKEVIGILDNRFENLAAKVEVSDMATPATYVRYTGNWKGSVAGWLPTPEAAGKPLPKTLPELKDFYLAGQWVEPDGGISSVALSGRNVAQLICAADEKRFITQEP